ncbi:FAD:protein FMN transferase [soil metagenome]
MAKTAHRVLIPANMPAPAPLPAAAVSTRLCGHSMGTSWSVHLLHPPQLSAAVLQAGIEQQLDLVVAQMSHWEADSALSRFNRAAAGSWHSLAPEFFKVLDYALYVAQQSRGAYDPAIGHLVNVWGFGPHQAAQAICPAMPDPATLQQARLAGGWQQLRLERATRRVRQPGGLALDLSSIAKGFSVDLVATYLADCGVTSYLVEVGGELRGLGCKADLRPWWVELEHPHSARHLGDKTIVALHGLAVATSGDYRRYFVQDGQRYAHTIDPRSGYPLQHNLASVTVLHAECMVADALATAILVMGLEAGLAYAEQLHLPCLLLSRDKSDETAQGDSDNQNEPMSEHLSSALRAMLE